jgi:hypothetical protein
LEKVESRGLTEASVGAGVAAVLTGTQIWVSTFAGYFSGLSMEGVERISTPSIRHLEEILFEKVESLGRGEVYVGVSPLPPC